MLIKRSDSTHCGGVDMSMLIKRWDSTHYGGVDMFYVDQEIG